MRFRYEFRRKSTASQHTSQSSFPYGRSWNVYHIAVYLQLFIAARTLNIKFTIYYPIRLLYQSPLERLSPPKSNILPNPATLKFSAPKPFTDLLSSQVSTEYPTFLAWDHSNRRRMAWHGRTNTLVLTGHALPAEGLIVMKGITLVNKSGDITDWKIEEMIA